MTTRISPSTVQTIAIQKLRSDDFSVYSPKETSILLAQTPVKSKITSLKNPVKRTIDGKDVIFSQNENTIFMRDLTGKLLKQFKSTPPLLGFILGGGAATQAFLDATAKTATTGAGAATTTLVQTAEKIAAPALKGLGALGKFAKFGGSLAAIATEAIFSEKLAVEPDMQQNPVKFTPPKPPIGTGKENPTLGETGGKTKLTNPNIKSKVPSSKIDIGEQLERLRESIPTHIFKQETPEEESKRTGLSVKNVIAERTANARILGYQDHMNEIRAEAIKTIVKAIKAAPAAKVVAWFKALSHEQRAELMREPTIEKAINQRINDLQATKTAAEIRKMDYFEASEIYDKLPDAQKKSLHPTVRTAYENKLAERIYALPKEFVIKEFKKLTDEQRRALPTNIKQAYYGKMNFNVNHYTNSAQHNMPKDFYAPLPKFNLFNPKTWSIKLFPDITLPPSKWDFNRW